MADLTAMLQAAAGAAVGEYEISRSLRFNSADSAYLNRTPASAGNRKTWTMSFWVKLGDLTKAGTSGWNTIFGAYTDNDNRLFAYTRDSTNGNVFQIFNNTGGSTNLQLISNQLFRDVSAWYHFVVALDTTQATAANRCKVYVNGSQITSWATATYPAQNADLFFNNNNVHLIGANYFSGLSLYHDGYLTEINFVDGSALTPSSFGEVNATTGVWSPIEYTGSYGTNGFYLNFSDNSGVTSTTLGKDQAGSNNWTPNNFSVTAGVGNDSLVDTPTQYGTDTGAGGEVRGNYCTGNPLNIVTNGTGVLKNGNLDCDDSSGGASYSRFPGTIGVSSGKWYFEANRTDANGAGNFIAFGVTNPATALGTGVYGGNPTSSGANANEWVLTDRAVACNNTTYTNLNSTLGNVAQNDVIQICVDMDTKKIWFGKNNTFVGSPSAGTSETFSNLPTTITPLAYTNQGDLSLNFGQRPFAYTAPSGFKALVTTNLPAPTVVQGDEYFNTVLYTGTGASQSITGVGFQPDWVWIKERNASADHGLYDAVRGVQNQLESNTTTAETTEATGLTAFGTDGFTVGALAQLNTSGDTYVAWNWNAGGANATNTDGTITSTVRANPTAGFSIVSYTGTGSAATVGHGLGAAPAMIIVKNRDQADAWQVYHAANTANPETDYLVLNTNAATADAADRWNDTAPTSTVFSIGNGVEVNTNTEDYIAYCFAAIPGFSAFGSYTGNGSADGPFVFTGFRPAWVLIKRTSATDSWVLYDVERSIYNVVDTLLVPNTSAVEATVTSLDIVSNGFKIRGTLSNINDSSNTYIYACFAESPFKFSLAR